MVLDLANLNNPGLHMWIFPVWLKAQLWFPVTCQQYCICPFCQGQSTASKISVHLSCGGFSEHDSSPVLCEDTTSVSSFPREGVKETLLRKDGQSWNQSCCVHKLSLNQTPYVFPSHLLPQWAYCSPLGNVWVGKSSRINVFVEGGEQGSTSSLLLRFATWTLLSY